MNNGSRGSLAGAGAMKWGGGCFATVLVFVVINAAGALLSRPMLVIPVEGPLPTR